MSFNALSIAKLGVGFGDLASDADKIDLILDILQNRQTLDPLTGMYTLYDDSGTIVLKTALAWEDVGRTIPYRGQGLSVLDALE